MSELDDRLARWKRATAQLKPSDDLRARLIALAVAQASLPVPSASALKLKLLLGGAGALTAAVVLVAGLMVATPGEELRLPPDAGSAELAAPAPVVRSATPVLEPSIEPTLAPLEQVPAAVPRAPATPGGAYVPAPRRSPSRGEPEVPGAPSSAVQGPAPVECTGIAAVQVSQRPLAAELERSSRATDPASNGLNARVNELRARAKRFRVKAPVIVALRLRLPEGVSPSAVAAQAEVLEGGWFVAEASVGWAPLWWFALPGYEPFSLSMPPLEAGEWYLGEVGFTPVRGGAATLRVRVGSSRKRAEVSLLPEVLCGLDAAPHNGAALTARGNEVTFPQLAKVSWRLIIREPGSEFIDRRLPLLRAGDNELQVWLKPARVLSVDFMVGRHGGLCAAPVRHARLVPGEPLTLSEGVTLRAEQRDGVIRFDGLARAGGFVTTGALDEVCGGDLTPRAPFETEPLRPGAVFVTTTPRGDSMLLRISGERAR